MEGARLVKPCKPLYTDFKACMRKYLIKNVSDDIIKSGIKAIIDNGGKVYTDNSFIIEGVKGNFKLQDGVLTITICEKPFLVSWYMIKENLREFFG